MCYSQNQLELRQQLYRGCYFYNKSYFRFKDENKTLRVFPQSIILSVKTENGILSREIDLEEVLEEYPLPF